MELSLLNKAKGQVIEAGITRLENIRLHDIGTMAQKPYEELANSMETINNFTKGKGKGVDFFDAQVSEHDTKFTEGEGSKNILVRVTDFLTGKEKDTKITHDKKSEVPFLRQVYQAVSEAVTGKKSLPIDEEVKASRERYNKYLDSLNNSSSKYAQMGDVKIKDRFTMAGNSYDELKPHINNISHFAKKENKEITFEDARALTRDCEYDSPAVENDFARKILVTVKDKASGKEKQGFIDYFEDSETPLIKKVSNKLGEMTTGEKGINIDDELGLKA